MDEKISTSSTHSKSLSREAKDENNEEHDQISSLVGKIQFIYFREVV